jgi:hypothetical protein
MKTSRNDGAACSSEGLISRKFIKLYDTCSKIKKQFESNDQYVNDTVYHYTTFAGLKGILESKRLWLSNYRGLNDDEEIIRDIKQAAISLQQNFHDNKFILNLGSTLTDILNILNIYICSFCLKKNHEPMWQKYAANGRGYALGFSKNFFKPQAIENNYTPIFFGYKVSYEPLLFEQFVLELANTIKNEIDHLSAGEKTNKNAIEIASILISHILTLLPKSKDNQWSEENEYRICHFEWNTIKTTKKIKSTKKDRKDERRKRVPKFYRIDEYGNKILTVKTEKIKQNNVIEIWVGPNSNNRDEILELKGIIRQQQYNVKINYANKM